VRLLYLADAPYIHTKRWVEHFAGLGHDCEVISFRPAAIEGARVTYVEGFERLGKLRYLLQAGRVARLVRERGPDIVHALHLTSYGFLGALSGAHPLIISAWGTDILEAPRLTPFHDWLTRYTLRRADLITATGPHLAAATAKYAPAGAEIKVVPYGVDLDRFQPQPHHEPRPLVVGSVARLSPEKGVRFLIEAFALLSSDTNDVVLEVAGDGPERLRLENLVRQRGLTDRVRFRGWVNHDALPAFLGALDVFVLPSVFEGFGVAAVEASAMALPVVGSRIHGIPDVVVDRETGLLVPPADPAALAAAIQTLVDDPALRVRMGEAGRAFVAGRYDWRENAALMEALYERHCLQTAT
jgi:glycosyltransferase involved in cell wall biosynthesis